MDLTLSSPGPFILKTGILDDREFTKYLLMTDEAYFDISAYVNK
jgi:hypothetical protein